MKELPKYIEKALKLRTKYSKVLRDQCTIIDDYAKKLGCIYDPDGCFISDIRIYCEEDAAENDTRNCLLQALNKNDKGGKSK